MASEPLPALERLQQARECGCGICDACVFAEKQKRWKLMPWRIEELCEQADKLTRTLNVHEIECLRDLLGARPLVELPATLTSKTESLQYEQDYTVAELAALCRTKDRNIERLESNVRELRFWSGKSPAETFGDIGRLCIRCWKTRAEHDGGFCLGGNGDTFTPEAVDPEKERFRDALTRIGRCCGNANFVANEALGHGRIADSSVKSGCVESNTAPAKGNSPCPAPESGANVAGEAGAVSSGKISRTPQ